MVSSLMRDLLEPPGDPMAAARRGARPVLRKRFYDKAVEEVARDYERWVAR